MIVRSGTYPNLTCSKSTSPTHSSGSMHAVLVLSSSISSSLRKANILSAAAAADWRLVAACADCVMGVVNIRIYTMNATIVPNLISPASTISAPATQTATYPKLPRNSITGCMMPLINWLLQLLS